MEYFLREKAVVHMYNRDFSGGSVVNNWPASAADTRDAGSISGLGRDLLEGGNGNPLLYSCLEKSMDRGAWQATFHAVAESDMTEHAHARIGTALVQIFIYTQQNIIVALHGYCALRSQTDIHGNDNKAHLNLKF